MSPLVLTTHQAAGNHSSVLQHVVLQLKSVVTSLPTDPSLFFWDHSIYWSLLSPPHLGTHKSSCQESGSKCEFSTQGIGGAHRPREGDLWVTFSQRIMNGLPAEALSTVSRNCIPFMTFDFLNDLSYLLSPRSHGGLAPEIWVLLERNWLLQQYWVDTSSLLSFSPMGDAPLASSVLCCVTLGWGAALTKFFNPLQSFKLFFFFLAPTEYWNLLSGILDF